MGRIALVTGGVSGIGAATAKLLKNSGYTVVANYFGNDADPTNPSRNRLRHIFCRGRDGSVYGGFAGSSDSGCRSYLCYGAGRLGYAWRNCGIRRWSGDCQGRDASRLLGSIGDGAHRGSRQVLRSHGIMCRVPGEPPNR